MSQGFKTLIPLLFLFAIGAAAQTVTTNTRTNALVAQENRTATPATVAAVPLNQPAVLFMNHLQSDGLLDHVFMKVTASVASTHTASTALVGCQPSCTDGLVCCLCVGSPTCETRTQCNIDCQK